MLNRGPLINASDLETVSYAKRPVLKVVAEAPHRQIIETHWNTALQQYTIWSIAFEACAKEILKEICRSDNKHCILHA